MELFMATRTQLFATSSLVALVALSGCASAQGDGAMTLAQTKQSVQLLRNASAERIDAAAVADIRKTGDQSFPCVTDDGNPDGLIRQWQSNAEVVLAEGADRIVTTGDLVQSLVDDGWVATEVSNGDSFGQTDLASASSLASISVASADQSAISIIRLTVKGPCVVTDGPDSDEVKQLD